MRRLALTALAIVAAGGGACGGSLTEPDAGPGQLSGIGGTGGATTGAAGGDGGPPPIIDVRPPDEPCSLEVHVMAIADETCRFAIPEPPCSYADRSHIGVRVGSAEIPRDPSGQDGWDYSDTMQTEIRINGPSCDAVTGGAGVTIIYKIILP